MTPDAQEAMRGEDRSLQALEGKEEEKAGDEERVEKEPLEESKVEAGHTDDVLSVQCRSQKQCQSRL